jgi:hypothetical protein
VITDDEQKNFSPKKMSVLVITCFIIYEIASMITFYLVNKEENSSNI